MMHCSRLFKQAKIGTEWYPLENLKLAHTDKGQVSCNGTFLSPGFESESISILKVTQKRIVTSP